MELKLRRTTVTWINYIHLFEGLAMLITGPFLMYFPQLTLDLYGVNHTPVAADIVPWYEPLYLATHKRRFGALVTLMGWMEWRMWKNLPRAWIEACLIADLLYLGAFYVFISRHGVWNFWSFGASALFPILWAPLRFYWLFGTSELR
jgi:hypothetical protein